MEILLPFNANFLAIWKYFYILPQTFWQFGNTSTFYHKKKMQDLPTPVFGGLS
jgi:hypothetical protein